MADKNALLPQKEMAVFSWRSEACDSVQEMRSNPGMNTGCWGRTQPRPEPHSFPKVTLKLRPERGGKWILKRKKNGLCRALLPETESIQEKLHM